MWEGISTYLCFYNSQTTFWDCSDGVVLLFFFFLLHILDYINYTPTRREGAILQSPCPSVCPSVHTFVTDISASTGRNDFITIQLFTSYRLLSYSIPRKKLYLTSASEKNHSKKYDINDFFGTVQNNLRKVKTPTRREGAILQSPCSSVSPSVCPSVHTFVTDISASTGRNDFIFDIWLWHG
jgi:hypothetical protein